MNTTYSLVSSKFSGEVRVTFNSEKLLTKFEVLGEMVYHTHLHILNYLPLTSNELDKLKAESRTLQVTEVVEEITFDMFWKKYNDSARSSKKKSLAKWNKFNTDNQRKAYFYYSIYINNIPPGVEKKYCETYLNAEMWNN